MSEYVMEVGPAAEVLANGRALISAPDLGADILVITTRAGIFAVRAVCPHLGRSLADAPMRGRYLVCPAHGRRYHVRTGRAAGPRGGQPLTRVRAWTDGGRLYLAVPADTAAGCEAGGARSGSPSLRRLNRKIPGRSLGWTYWRHLCM